MLKMLSRSVLLIIAVMASMVAPAMGAASADTGIMACRYAAYPPGKAGGNVRGWGEKWECGGISWTITVQRHRGGSWWQNEARNFADGDGWVSAEAGCARGTWTYRTILESAAGHKTVSGHATIAC